MGLRYYSPSQARWTQPDPALSQLPFANTYTYVGNNPINGIDPAGALSNCTELSFIVAVRAVAAGLSAGVTGIYRWV